MNMKLRFFAGSIKGKEAGHILEKFKLEDIHKHNEELLERYLFNGAFVKEGVQTPPDMKLLLQVFVKANWEH